MPTFSLIIPVKPGGFVAAVEHVMNLMAVEPWYEIILAEGNAPSQQRNRAAEAAGGDILFFLDDDSLVQPGNFARCADAMVNPSVAVVGGPSITPDRDSWLQKLFGYALASPFGSGGVRNRYRIQGSVRPTTDKELILCNLAVRRSVFLALGGFNERLYPNEENEFMERVVSAGHTLIHEPTMAVYRSQRSTLKAFIRQMFSYGRGRGEQTLLTSSWSVTSFIPLLFVLYLALLPVAMGISALLIIPLLCYLAGALVASLAVLLSSGRLSAILLPVLFPLMHLSNGIGLLWGLLRGKPAPRRCGALQIRKLKALG